jgi:hypothetical protein
VACVIQPAVISWGTRWVEGSPKDTSGSGLKDACEDPLAILVVLESSQLASEAP